MLFLIKIGKRHINIINYAYKNQLKFWKWKITF